MSSICIFLSKESLLLRSATLKGTILSRPALLIVNDNTLIDLQVDPLANLLTVLFLKPRPS